MLVQYNSVFVPLCSPNTCKDVFNPNVTAFQSNCAEGLHFSAFYFYCFQLRIYESDTIYLAVCYHHTTFCSAYPKAELARMNSSITMPPISPKHNKLNRNRSMSLISDSSNLPMSTNINFDMAIIVFGGARRPVGVPHDLAGLVTVLARVSLVT